MLTDPIAAMVKVAQVLEALGVPYLVAGSIASSYYGQSRPTQDVDLVADLKPEHVAPLVAALSGEFYVDDQMIRDALAHASSFNVIHLDTLDKVDVFLYKAGPWATEEMRRRRSDRQWNDVLGVLKVRGPALDIPYVRQWSRDLSLDELLSRVLQEAGLPTSD